MSDKEKCVLVCVTGQRQCERLISEGVQLGAAENLPIVVVHVAAKGQNVLGNDSESDALEYLYQRSKDAGADMHVLRAKSALDTLAKFAKDAHAEIIVIGRSPNTQEHDFSHALSGRLPRARMHVVVS